MEQTHRSWVEHIMGMPMSIHLRGPGASSEAAEVAVTMAYDELRRADELFSTYRPESQVSRLNAGTLTLADADGDVRVVAEVCDVARDRTQGAFDAHLPAPGGGTWFDPSGLVKTWAAERAFAHLATVELCDAYLGAAGDIVVHTQFSTPWRIGVEVPMQANGDATDGSDDRLLDVIELSAGGIATSGTARRGAHLVDPRTGAPADALLAATVVGPSLMWADVYATAACAYGDDAMGWLETLDGYDALVVFAGTGQVRRTRGWCSAR
ncbi:MAG: FAD:protein transferase [Frankiaceae bacterium]|nr:FAD:protein transferase [Frankiaceae bacterium]